MVFSLLSREFPPIDDLKGFSHMASKQEPEEREIMAKTIGEEPDDSTSLIDLEYNFVRKRDEKWHP